MFIIALLVLFSIYSAHIARQIMIARAPKFNATRKTITLPGKTVIKAVPISPDAEITVEITNCCGTVTTVPIKRELIYDSSGEAVSCAVAPAFPSFATNGEAVDIRVTNGQREYVVNKFFASDPLWWERAIATLASSTIADE